MSSTTVPVDFKALKDICSRAVSDHHALVFALEWAERAEKLALEIQTERDRYKLGLTQIKRIAELAPTDKAILNIADGALNPPPPQSEVES